MIPVPDVSRHVAFLGGSDMAYEELAPPPDLAPWVAVSWRMRARAPFELRILPDGCMDLISGDVVGSLSAPLTVAFRAGETAQGIRFHPGGFPALTGIPASELVGVRLALTDLIPRFRSLHEIAAEADRPDPLAASTFNAAGLENVWQDSGYSPRQLRRRVIAATGHSPKRLLRILRMQDVLKGGRGESWARTAADHGYFDESHMANDIRKLAGATPHALLA
jgi:AraC-like DNA-binding protein